MRIHRPWAAASTVIALAGLLGAAAPAPVLVAQQGIVIESSRIEGLEVIPIRQNFFMIAGAGGNIAVQIGPDGAVVVDAGATDQAEKVVATIRRLSPRPIRYVINTNADADHVGGNDAVAKAGRTVLFPGNAAVAGMTNNGAAAILAAEGVLRRMSAPTGQVSAWPTSAWPTETFAHPRKYMYLNDEGIEVLHQPAAHSDGDSIVFFRRSDVVVAGDILDTRQFPVIDIARGGSVQGVIAALNKLIEIAIPSVPIVSREAGTLVIPGHGWIMDQTDIAEYRDMVSIVRDRVQDLIRQKKTLSEIKAAVPTQGYTARYGSSTGASTTEKFVEAVYESLTGARTGRPQQGATR